MKQIAFFLVFLFSNLGVAQKVIQTFNSGGLINLKSVSSVGEIFLISNNVAPSNFGFIGIYAQLNGSNLEVEKLDITPEISVYPNPTQSKIYFESDQDLLQHYFFVYNAAGQMISKLIISQDNSLDLSVLSAGIYFIKIDDLGSKTFKIIKK